LVGFDPFLFGVPPILACEDFVSRGSSLGRAELSFFQGQGTPPLKRVTVMSFGVLLRDQFMLVHTDFRLCESSMATLRHYSQNSFALILAATPLILPKRVAFLSRALKLPRSNSNLFFICFISGFDCLLVPPSVVAVFLVFGSFLFLGIGAVLKLFSA